MMRELIPLVLAGVAVVPDWASAFGRRVCVPARPARVLAVPVYPVVIAPPCLPAFDVYPAAPLVVAPAAPEATPTPAKPAPEPKTPPRVEVTPATGGIKPVEYTNPAAPTAAVPSPPALSAPPAASTPLAAPRPLPESTFTPPALNPPTPPAPGTIPPTAVPVTPAVTPATGTTTNKPNEAPLKIDLAPATPGAPDLPAFRIPDPRTSKYPPADPGYDVFPAAGPAAAGAVRAVDFTNLSGSTVRLTVEGRSVTLPHRHTVSARVPVQFKWKIGAGDERTGTVGGDAPGAEVVIRRAGL